MTQPVVPVAHARTVVVVGIAAITATSWAHLVHVASRMGDMSSVLAMPMTASWTATQAGLMVTMWVVMMAAMMLPSAIPMAITYDRMDRLSPANRRGSTTAFVLGYLVVWAAFATAATAVQWALHAAGLVDAMGRATQSSLAATLLIGAGVFQLTPLKQRSLGACRTPLGFLATCWRDGPTGALRMGLHHGITCLGCCAALMMLLFVLGVMNLVWVAALALFVLVEKATKHGERAAALGGVAMIVWGFAAMTFVN